MKTAKDIFTEAFALVRNPETWTQGDWARNAEGEYVYADDPGAVCWCSSGAVLRAMEAGCFSPNGPDMAVINALCADVGDWKIAHFNDTHTHAEVVAAWERAGKAQGWLPS
jgi:hypothetical protein